MDLSTNYLGLSLQNPIVPSASPLSKDLDKARKLEDMGASALVMNSLFEEEILEDESRSNVLVLDQSNDHDAANTGAPDSRANLHSLDAYLNCLEQLKARLSIPVIASLNGVTDEGWIKHSKDIEGAGADALELNIYYLPADIAESGEAVEERYINILRLVKQQVKIPVTCKIGAMFSSPGHFIKQLEAAGADGVALFNRFYQPDINIRTLSVDPMLNLSSPNECLLRMHWIAIIRDHTKLSLAATGGIHNAESVAKLLLAGADVTHLCSALLRHGPQLIATIIKDLTRWMEENNYESVSQLKATVSRKSALNPVAFERLNYLELLKNYIV